jgi:aspartate-semialdehyde dehydrogenase
VRWEGKDLPLETLSQTAFDGIDLAIFCAGGSVSREWIPLALHKGVLVIDNSSAFRMDPHVPLIIPEINPHALHPHHRLIASPNCSATLMLMALAPLHRVVPIQRIVAATYQSASGAGYRAMRELEEETQAHLERRPFQRSVFPYPYAFNLFPHNSPFQEEGYSEEEIKMREEGRKILEAPTLGIHATCVRVPILRAHSEALNVTFTAPLSVERAYSLLREAPGITILEDRACNRFPMPSDASGQDSIFCGRIRQDLSCPNTLDLWVVGDQLLKGAALNAVQIVELCLQQRGALV